MVARKKINKNKYLMNFFTMHFIDVNGVSSVAELVSYQTELLKLIGEDHF